MNLRQLEMFLAVAEFGGYTKAGLHLHISHSAIHRQVRMLEHEFQQRLIIRNGRRVTLTEPGHALLEHALRIRQDLMQAQRQLRELTYLQVGELRIGTVTPALVWFLPLVLVRFQEKFPSVLLRGTTSNTDDLLGMVQRGDVDLAITILPTDSTRKHLDLPYEPLFLEEFVLAVGREHPLAGKKSVRLDELHDFRFIMYSKGTFIRRFLDRFFHDAGVSPVIVMELENEAFIEKMIGINMGIAILSRRRAINDKIDYVRIARHPIHLEIGMAFPNSDYRPRSVLEFAQLCREIAAVHQKP